MRDSGYILDKEFDGTESRSIPFLDSGVCTIKLPKLRDVVYTLNEIVASEGFENFKKLWNKVVDERKN